MMYMYMYMVVSKALLIMTNHTHLHCIFTFACGTCCMAINDVVVVIIMMNCRVNVYHVYTYMYCIPLRVGTQQ